MIRFLTAALVAAGCSSTPTHAGAGSDENLMQLGTCGSSWDGVFGSGYLDPTTCSTACRDLPAEPGSACPAAQYTDIYGSDQMTSCTATFVIDGIVGCCSSAPYIDGAGNEDRAVYFLACLTGSDD